MRFCLIGAGRAGLVHAGNLRSRIRNADLVAVYDADEAALAAAGRELGVSRCGTDYRHALDQPDIDAVIIATPTFLHCRIACDAAAAGKHVFLEKPMAVTVEECRSINGAVARAGVKCQIGFMRRFDDGFVRAAELLASGRMGRVMTIKSTGRGPGLPPPWIYDISRSNGILAEVNSHDFDSVRWLAGSDIRRVYAEAGNFKCLDIRAQWPAFYDNAVVTLRFASGAIGSIDGTCPCGYGYDARMEVLCEGGLLQIGTVQEPGLTEVRVDGSVRGRAVKSWRNLFKDAYVAEIEHFIACVREDKTPRVTGEDGLKAVEAVAASNQSILQGRPVDLEGAAA